MRKKIIRSPRLARKVREKKTARAFLLLVLFLAILGGLLYGLSRPAFRIERIEVVGSSRIPKERVVDTVARGIAGAYMGFIPKSHTLLFPRNSLEKSLIDEFPTFSNVSISLNGLASLHVAVREREPSALWCAGADGCYLIDDTEVVVADAPAGTERMYYLLEKAATSSPLGIQIIEKERLARIISFLTQLERIEFDPVKVQFKDGQDIEVFLSGDMRLLLIDGDYARALTNLETLLAQSDVLPGKRGSPSVAYIDLRYGNKIYFKPR